MKDDPTGTDRRRAGGVASGPPRSHVHPRRARPRGDGAALSGRAHRAQGVSHHRGGRVAPPAAGAGPEPDAPRPSDHGAGAAARPGAHLDGGATGHRPEGAGHCAERAPDPQVPEGDGRPLAADDPQPAPQARPSAGGARRAGAGQPGKRQRAGRLQLAYLDECGFAPSQPVTYSWVPAQARKRVPYENPQRRRYNVMALYAPAGPAPFLDWHGRSIHLTSDELIGLLAVRCRTDLPLIVVLDNASFHRSLDVQDAIPELWKRGIYLYYLPPYSPELNGVERVFRTIKHYDLPERTYATLPRLITAVEAAFARQEANLLT